MKTIIKAVKLLCILLLIFVAINENKTINSFTPVIGLTAFIFYILSDTLLRGVGINDYATLFNKIEGMEK